MSTSEIQSVTRNDLDNLSEDLKEMPENMRLFSLCFRALYSDQAIGGYSKTAVKSRKIREDTRKDAMVYVKYILPVTTSFVRSVKEYFETYEALSYEEWLRMLPDILEDTKAHKDLAQTVLHLYQKILVPLKTRQDDAKIVMKEFVGLQSKFEEMCGKYEATANKKRKWANALLFVPVVNMIACPLLGKSARGDSALAVESKIDAEIHKSAALAVAETLIPALSSLINGLENVARFFTVLERELGSFEKKGENAHKKLHYKVMCYSARDIKSLCYAFYQALPDVRTDFEALPIEDSDQTYAEKWWEKTRSEIRSQSAIKALVGAFPGSMEMDDRKMKQPPHIPAPTQAKPKYFTQGVKLPGMGTPPKLPTKASPKLPTRAPPKIPTPYKAPPKPPRSTNS